jgi:hypothetical protein
MGKPEGLRINSRSPCAVVLNLQSEVSGARADGAVKNRPPDRKLRISNCPFGSGAVDVVERPKGPTQYVPCSPFPEANSIQVTQSPSIKSCQSRSENWRRFNWQVGREIWGSLISRFRTLWAFGSAAVGCSGCRSRGMWASRKREKFGCHLPSLDIKSVISTLRPSFGRDWYRLHNNKKGNHRKKGALVHFVLRVGVLDVERVPLTTGHNWSEFPSVRPGGVIGWGDRVPRLRWLARVAEPMTWGSAGTKPQCELNHLRSYHPTPPSTRLQLKPKAPSYRPPSLRKRPGTRLGTRSIARHRTLPLPIGLDCTLKNQEKRAGQPDERR